LRVLYFSEKYTNGFTNIKKLANYGEDSGIKRAKAEQRAIEFRIN